MFNRIPGTKDILPDEILIWQRLEAISREVFSLYNFQEIRLPLLEDAGLFNRSLGEFTEIVQKQMFLIRNQESLYALRPEATASIVRAYIENNLDKTSGLAKLYYIGPMFRLERPQKGRLRQFHHIGTEMISSSKPEADIEAISLADALLKAYGISGYRITLNSLGCVKDKIKLTELLKSELNDKLDDLCLECKTRFGSNILRILDCKNPSCKDIIAKLNIGERHLCDDCATHFAQVRNGLDSLKMEYTIDPQLVRGLDYYTRSVFEIKHSALGAQDAIGAGGRYDNLTKELGGPDTAAVGFAFGVERLILAGSDLKPQEIKSLVYVITLGEAAKSLGLTILNDLRRNKISADTDFEGKSLKGAMRAADAAKARFVLIIGENELQNNTVMLKDMEKKVQREIKLAELIKELKSIK